MPWPTWRRLRTDRELCEQAKEHSVRELADVARTMAEQAAARSKEAVTSRASTGARCASTTPSAP